MLNCTILTTDSEVDAIADEWRKLYDAAATSPYSSYDWFHIWRRTTGSSYGRTLHIITGRKDGRLVAVLPLTILKRKGFRMLQAIGGEAFYQCDMVCEDPAYADELWKVARTSKHYDFAHIRDTAADSLCEKAMAKFAGQHHINRGPYLTISWKTPDEWRETLPNKLNKDLKRRQRRLEEKGPVTYNVYKTWPLPEGVLETMVAHKTEWGKQTGLDGMFDQPEVLTFCKQFAQYLAGQGNLLISELKCGDTPIAHQFMMVYGKRILSYVIAVDYQWSAFSPGHLSYIHTISWAIENGFAEFDHQHGDMPHKYLFANNERECKEFIFSNSLFGKLGAFIFLKRREMAHKSAVPQKPVAEAA